MKSLFNNTRQFIRAITKGDFQKNPNAPSISENKQRALSMGLILSEQAIAYTNSLTTGVPRYWKLEFLEEGWEIYNSEDALDTIKWLYSKGHREYFSKIYPLTKMNIDMLDEKLETIFEEDTEQAIYFWNNLIECISEYGNDSFIAFND